MFRVKYRQNTHSTEYGENERCREFNKHSFELTLMLVGQIVSSEITENCKLRRFFANIS